MDDRDFLNALKTNGTFAKEASEYFSELRKTAGPKELMGKGVGKAIDFVSQRKAPLLGAAIGAATMTAIQYLNNKPGKDGKPSKQRQSDEGTLAAREKSLAETKAQGKEPTFGDQMSHAHARSAADVSRIAEKHPVRGALLAAPIGALGGMGLGYAARKLVG